MKYKWHWDSLMGVGRFIRIEDNAVTLWETGSDGFELNEMFKDNPERVDIFIERTGYEFYD